MREGSRSIFFSPFNACQEGYVISHTFRLRAVSFSFSLSRERAAALVSRVPRLDDLAHMHSLN